MGRLNWAALVKKIDGRRADSALFFKPVCIIAAIDLTDEGKIVPDNIDAHAMIDRFSDYITPFYPDRGKDGFKPLWHLSNDRLWTFFNGKEVVGAKSFPHGAPGTKAKLFASFDRLAIHKDLMELWTSSRERRALRDSMLLMLDDSDADSRRLIPPLFDKNHLQRQDRWPSDSELKAYFDSLRDQPRLFRDDLSEIWPRDDRSANLWGTAEQETRPADDISVEPIPAQGPGPHFALDQRNRLRLAKPSDLDGAGNDVSRIEQILPLVRQAADDLATQVECSNAFPGLKRDLAGYRGVIARTTAEISWGLVWGLGVRLEQAAAAAEREIADRLAPSLEDGALSALLSLRVLHGPLILASREGRALQEQADRFQMTREEQNNLRLEAQAFAKSLQSDEAIIDNEAAQVMSDAAATIGADPHPERGSVFGIATLRDVTILLVSAATLATFVPVGIAIGHAAGGVAGAALAWPGFEALKKSKRFVSATAALSMGLDKLHNMSDSVLQERLGLLKPFTEFVRNNSARLSTLAAALPQLRWMEGYLHDLAHPTLARDHIECELQPIDELPKTPPV